MALLWLCEVIDDTAHCTFHTVLCNMYSALNTVHITLYSTYCTLHTVFCTLNSAHCTVHIELWILYTTHFCLHTVRYALYTAQVLCRFYTAHCILHTVHCTQYSVHCTLHTVFCTLYTAHCIYSERIYLQASRSSSQSQAGLVPWSIVPYVAVYSYMLDSFMTNCSICSSAMHTAVLKLQFGSVKCEPVQLKPYRWLSPLKSLFKNNITSKLPGREAHRWR